MTEHNHTDDSDTEKSDRKAEALLLVGVLLFIAAWAGSVVLWGVPGFYIPAVILVPVIYVLMVWGSRG
jgi:hypothetical protein